MTSEPAEDASTKKLPLRARLRPLMERVVAHDEGAFESVLLLMGPAMYALCVRLLVNPQVALEVTQEVFLEIWSKAATYDSNRGHPDTWIMTITHRRAMDRAAGEERAARHETDYFIRTFTREYDQTSDTALDVLEHDNVRALLENLTPTQREAICLAYYDGLTHKVVAARQSVPLPTAKSRIRDSIIVLRKALTSSAAGDPP